MKIAIISDIHDHIINLEKTLAQVSKQGCGHILALGDYCAPFTVRKLAEISLPINAIFGNNDGDQAGIILSCQDKISFSSLNQEFNEIELDNQKIAFCHYPKLAKFLASSNKYDSVFFGHTHIKGLEQVDSTILCNPGAVCGIVAGRSGVATFAIYDTQDKKINFIEIGHG